VCGKSVSGLLPERLKGVEGWAGKTVRRPLPERLKGVEGKRRKNPTLTLHSHSKIAVRFLSVRNEQPKDSS